MLRELVQIAFGNGSRLLAAVIVLSLASAVLEATALAFLAPLMAVLTNTPAESLRWPLGLIASRFAWAGAREAVLMFAAILAVLMVIRFAVIAVNFSLAVELEARTVRHLRLRCLAVLFFSPQSFIDQYDNARIVQHFNEQSLRAGEVLRVTLRAVTNVFTFMLNLALLFVLSVELTFAVILLLVLLSTAISFVPRRIAANAKRYVSALYDYNVRLGDLIAGIKTVRSYATFGREQRLVRKVMEQQIEAQKGKVLFTGITAPIFEALGFVAMCSILAISVFLVGASQWLAILAPFVVILARTIPQAAALNLVRSTVNLHAEDYRSLRQFTGQLAVGSSAGLALDNGRFESIELVGVSFSYAESAPVLRNVSLAVRRGERVLLVGPSGAGKTTVLNLMLGLYETCAGAVRVNGQDLKSLNREQWAAHVGIVEQSPFVFNDTVRANVAYRDETVSDSAIYCALAAVGLKQFVDALPGALATELGDSGNQLSGGQRQRLAFARALCHSPDLLILDEPTSALDKETEAALIEGVRRDYPGMTIIAVSHSEAMRELFDRVVHLNDGMLVALSRDRKARGA